MPFHNVKNNCSSTLKSNVTETDTSINVASDVFPDVPFYITIDNEIMEVTAKVDNDFTITRLNPVAHALGTNVELRMVAELIIELQEQIIIAKSNIIKNNYSATTDPTVTDDLSKGYSVGSEWINITTRSYFKCGEGTLGNASWEFIANLSNMPSEL